MGFLVEMFVGLVLLYAYITTISLYVFHWTLEDLERKIDELIEREKK